MTRNISPLLSVYPESSLLVVLVCMCVYVSKHLFHCSPCGIHKSLSLSCSCALPHMHAHTSIVHVAGIGNNPIMKQWSSSDTIPGLADKSLMYRALCSLCWDSIRLPNSRACLEWDGGVRALSYGPSGAASLHSVCLILVSQPQGEALCLQLWLTDLTCFICFCVVFFFFFFSLQLD